MAISLLHFFVIKFPGLMALFYSLKILWSSHVWCISEQTFKVVICLSFQEEWWWCCILSAWPTQDLRAFKTLWSLIDCISSWRPHQIPKLVKSCLVINSLVSGSICYSENCLPRTPECSGDRRRKSGWMFTQTLCNLWEKCLLSNQSFSLLLLLVIQYFWETC